MHPTRKTRTNAPLFSDRTNASSPIFFGGCFGELFISKRNNEFDSICKFAAKELDNETNYTYFGARYGACSTECGNRDISIWLSVDPLSDKRSWLSPYNYCQWNPIRRVDPDGALDEENVDWFQSKAGNLLWADENSSTIIRNDEELKNVGTSASVEMANGNFINFYQNVALSISNVPISGEEKVLNNSELRGKLLNRNSPLSQKSQTGLLTSSMRKTQKDFIKTSASLAFHTMEMLGDITSATGYACSVTGLGSSLGLGLISLGESFSRIGGLGQAGLSVLEENYDNAIYKASSVAFSRGSSTWIGKQNFKNSEKILGNLWTDITRKPIDYTVGKSLEKK